MTDIRKEPRDNSPERKTPISQPSSPVPEDERSILESKLEGLEGERAFLIARLAEISEAGGAIRQQLDNLD
jgi:hypothetical protein